MKRNSTFKRFTALLACLMLLSLIGSSFIGCTSGDASADTTVGTDETKDPSGTDNSDPTGKVTYTVEVQSLGGMKLSGISVYVYTDETLEDLDGYVSTDENGIATFELKPSDTYHITLVGVPAGYKVEESYTFTGTSAKIVLTSSVITGNTGLAGVSYKLGDVMRDFTVTTSDGNTWTLSEALKDKDMVLLNFWFSQCGPCGNEFPYMNSSYEKYKDDVEVIALTHDPRDTQSVVANYKESMGLTFPMASEDLGFKTAFNLQNYPTSVVVDRYGVICLVHVGAIVSEYPFTSIFDYFTADNYVQKIFQNPEELTPTEKPNVTMPSSDEMAAVLNKGDITVSYAPEANDEYSWPFVITEKDGVPCIKASNSHREGSYATLYANIELKKDQVLAFDYFTSTELSSDIMYVLVDRKDIYQISGHKENNTWETCYSFVAPKDGTYELSFCYLKDSSDSVGEDTVYVKDLRVLGIGDIDKATYIPRYAAADRKADGFGYENYATVVYNETDGYYHVGTVDGPILLADLMKATNFSETPIYYLAYEGKITLNGKNYYEDILPFCTLASNSAAYGLCSVTKELRELLEITATAVGIEGDPNEWLQMCLYYDAYGPGAEHKDPIKGLSNFSAFTAVEGSNNSVSYDRVIMPRGLKYKFVPEKSGAYRITSDSEYEVNAWIFLEDGSIYTEFDGGERLYSDRINCSMVAYLEAGQNYYINIAFYDVYQVGTFTFDVSYLGETYELFRSASPGFFTYEESTNGSLNEILAGGIKVVYSEEDGYYHELRADGSVGSILYVDFLMSTAIFGDRNLEMLINAGGFDFSKSADDEYILNYIKTNGDGWKEKLRAEWEEINNSYAEEERTDFEDIYKLDDIEKGIYHGKGNNMTEAVKTYLDKKIPYSDETPELEGCIPVDKQLAEILRQLMDKYTFAGVDNSWTKLCYYYQYFG